jgi:hypothetical protein
MLVAQKPRSLVPRVELWLADGISSTHVNRWQAFGPVARTSIATAALTKTGQFELSRVYEVALCVRENIAAFLSRLYEILEGLKFKR